MDAYIISNTEILKHTNRRVSFYICLVFFFCPSANKILHIFSVYFSPLDVLCNCVYERVHRAFFCFAPVKEEVVCATVTMENLQTKMCGVREETRKQMDTQKKNEKKNKNKAKRNIVRVLCVWCIIMSIPGRDHTLVS